MKEVTAHCGFGQYCGGAELGSVVRGGGEASQLLEGSLIHISYYKRDAGQVCSVRGVEYLQRRKRE